MDQAPKKQKINLGPPKLAIPNIYSCWGSGSANNTKSNKKECGNEKPKTK